MRKPSFLSIVAVGLVLLTFSGLADASTNTVSPFIAAFSNVVTQWYSTILTVSEEIFFTLFGIDFVYLVAQWLIGGKDVHEIFTSFIKKFITIGFFYTVLLNSQTLLQDVYTGFQTTGQQAGGYGSASVSSIFSVLMQVWTALLSGPTSSSTHGLLWNITHMGTAALSALLGIMLSGITALIVLLILVYVVIELFAVKMEALLVGSVGALMLGFSGSRWTVQYAEGFFKYAVSVGVRLLVLTLWVGFVETQLGHSVTTILDIASHNGSSTVGLLEGYGEVLIFFLLIGWMTKKLPSIAGSVLSGSSALSGGEMISAGVAAGVTAAAALATGGAALAAGGAAAGAGALTGAQAASGAAAGSLGGATGAGAGGAAGSLGAVGSGASSTAGAAGNAAEGTAQAAEAVPAPQTSGASQQQVDVIPAPIASTATQSGGRVMSAAQAASSSAPQQRAPVSSQQTTEPKQSSQDNQTFTEAGASQPEAAQPSQAAAEQNGFGGSAQSARDTQSASPGNSGQESVVSAPTAGVASQTAPQTGTTTSVQTGGEQSPQPQAPQSTSTGAGPTDHRASAPNTPTQPVSGGSADVQAPQTKSLAETLKGVAKTHKEYSDLGHHVHQAIESVGSPGNADAVKIEATGAGLKHSE